MRKMRIVSLLLTLIMIFSVFPTASAATPSPTFSDVPTSHWAYQYIERASDKGWVAGIIDLHFYLNRGSSSVSNKK